MSWVQSDRDSLRVTCPKCGAGPLDRCHTIYGGPTSTHAARRSAGQTTTSGARS